MADLSSAVCEVHDSDPLRGMTITLGSRREAHQEDALCCSNVGCDRFYTPERGYFRAKDGEYIDQGVPSVKAQCRHNSEPVYMFLMRKDGELLWTCPKHGCQATKPYQA